jgi:sulfate-transporting ATPase
LFFFLKGAGKSTLIKMLIGKEQPDDGVITVGETVKAVSVGQGKQSFHHKALNIMQ